MGRVAYSYFFVCENKEESQCILTHLNFISLRNLRPTCKHSCYTVISCDYKCSSDSCSWLLGIKHSSCRRKGRKSYYIFNTVFWLLCGYLSLVLLAAGRGARSYAPEIGICLQDGGQSACFHVCVCWEKGRQRYIKTFARFAGWK